MCFFVLVVCLYYYSKKFLCHFQNNYASKYYLTEIWKPADSVTVWLAQYSKKITYKGTFYMWQVSDCGKIDGIDGPVDMDILMPEGGGHGPQD